MKRFLTVFALVANLVFVDALVKEIAFHHLRGGPSVIVIPGLFNLAYVENRGCAWGLFQGQVWPLAVFGLAALALLVWKRRSVFLPGWGGGLVEGVLYAGIVGNVIDRLFRGFVIDLFDFHWGLHHFPCFNVADACITCAAAALILQPLFGKRR